MAQFTLDTKTEVGKITLANYVEIEKDLTNALYEYKSFSVSPITYREAKTKRAELNKFEKALNQARLDIKKQYLEPYNTFENQIKYLSGLVANVSESIDKGIKEIDDIQQDYSPATSTYAYLTEDKNPYTLLDEDGFKIVNESYNVSSFDDMAENDVIETEADGFIDFSVKDPFSEGNV